MKEYRHEVGLLCRSKNMPYKAGKNMSTIKSRKPAPFIAPDSQMMTTQTEVSKRKQKAEMLKKNRGESIFNNGRGN